MLGEASANCAVLETVRGAFDRFTAVSVPHFVERQDAVLVAQEAPGAFAARWSDVKVMSHVEVITCEF